MISASSNAKVPIVFRISCSAFINLNLQSYEEGRVEEEEGRHRGDIGARLKIGNPAQNEVRV